MKEILPDKPSELIAVALRDLAKAERSPKYEINMGRWFQKDGDICEVCLAGSVIAFSLKPDKSVRALEPNNYPDDIEHKLEALDEFRCGNIGSGLSYLGIELPRFLADEESFPEYEKNPRGFKAAMKEMQKHLARLGL